MQDGGFTAFAIMTDVSIHPCMCEFLEELN